MALNNVILCILLVTAILSVYGSQILIEHYGTWLKNLEIRYSDESLLKFKKLSLRK
jgi:uncharacterized membrane protein (DUF2068 family)